ncbi:SxtJ family membrane protein [Leptospira santarosai]|uniref:SxtJ family membrane protein n=1 Tax=Leptospira santarosai TaxID=28183 RepID=UPI0024AEF259|nr:SxtJ family membrane protein [Leptospira santarosai]MDI7172561.1 SxtJ family membrane protein [Leptospira santarosai]MDI7194301.1 SxtJ family membrane protein [Leptospira santarosai]MDO6396613.1 SxtJ family membrane protein [Leptospira santarosai]MDO6404142.1 SxtJ family membrane protein [Leptospira santarosai]
MTHERKETTIQELRSFGLIVGGVFLSVFGLLVPFWKNGNWNPWFSSLGLALIIVAILSPSILKYPHKGWMFLGGVLGAINTRILLSVIYFVLFTPFGLLRRIFKMDPLSLRLDEKLDTYRKSSDKKDPHHMEKPF